MSRMIPFVVLALAVSFTACGGAQPAGNESADDLTGTNFQDAEELLNTTNGAQLNRWWSLRRQLEAAFDDVCGDTYCGGDYSNLRPLSLRCSVTLKTGAIKSCKYVFAGSYEQVNAATGAVKVTARTFACGFTTTATPAALMDHLLAPGPTPALRRTLPGNSKSIYDSLGGCL